MALASLSACASSPHSTELIDAGYTGDFSRVRQQLKSELASDDSQRSRGSSDIDRNLILNRMRLALLTLADGYAPAGNPNIEALYDLLRKQGLNRDATVSSVVINEDLKIWKGEPFEQALAFHYIGMHMASQGSWDNTRAAVLNSLFQLRDFGKDASGNGKSTEAVVRDAQQKGDDKLAGYVAEQSDFKLGYLMAGIANQQIARGNGDPDRLREASDYFRQTTKLDSGLRELAAELESGQYNTVLVVDFGQGPQKIGTGPDGAISSFEPMTASDGRRLRVATAMQSVLYPAVCDVNVMALDHRWNNLEDMRKAKSTVGSLLMIAGAGAAIGGAAANSNEAVIAGVAAMAAGAFAKAGAHADTRYCEVMPQRVYVVPLRITDSNTKIDLQIEGSPTSRLVLTGLSPPTGKVAQLRYVRMVPNPAWSPRWAVSGQVVYSNDFTGENNDPIQLPYILGGKCVRTPTQAAMESYQRSGFLRDMTLTDLKNLYQDEGVYFDVREDAGEPGLHVLEGGRSMYAPLPGTLGFARLFCGEHSPYQPRSPRTRDLANRIAQQSRAAAPSSNHIAPAPGMGGGSPISNSTPTKG